MKLIVATIPGLQDIYNANAARLPKFHNLGDILSGLLNIAFYVAVFLAFYYLVWGGFQYIMAQGKKEDLQKATARITWALIGLVVVLTAYLIATFASEIFKDVLLKSKGWLPF